MKLRLRMPNAHTSASSDCVTWEGWNDSWKKDAVVPHTKPQYNDGDTRRVPIDDQDTRFSILQPVIHGILEGRLHQVEEDDPLHGGGFGSLVTQRWEVASAATNGSITAS